MTPSISFDVYSIRSVFSKVKYTLETKSARVSNLAKRGKFTARDSMWKSRPVILMKMSLFEKYRCDSASKRSAQTSSTDSLVSLSNKFWKDGIEGMDNFSNLQRVAQADARRRSAAARRRLVLAVAARDDARGRVHLRLLEQGKPLAQKSHSHHQHQGSRLSRKLS